MADPLELADSVQPGSAGFKITDARVTAPYFVDGDDVQGQILSILGTNQEGDDGSINRSLPKCHSQYPFLTAASINLVGHGKPAVTDSEASDEAQPPAIALQYGLYDEYTGTVEFLQSPYQYLPNSDVYAQTEVYFDESGNEKFVEYVNEWERMVEVDEVTDPKIITATMGEMFYVNGAETGSPPHGFGFPGTPRIPYPEKLITLRWHQVPYRYLSSARSFFKRYQLTLNQLPFSIQGYDFDPGQLLLLTHKYTRYTPPFPLPNPLASSSRFALEKWVDVEITLAYADRPVYDPPAFGNANFIPHHHNALVWFGDRSPHTVVTGTRDAEDTWVPLYFSSPMPHVLFTDPDAIDPNPRDP